ncbi:MAG: tripartite tricarboxylate transporter substrate binding protein [Pseudolabrys sp.]|nr:tripartite tricarboxylate transporter substrate binding protein [Pseudolabrys sp.]
MKRLSLNLLSAACIVTGIVAGLSTASAQDKYPTRSIKVLVPYGPGGATDITARIVGDEFQKITGHGFIVINKPGANGLLAIDELVNSPADGYTIMVGNVTTNTITPLLYKDKMSKDYTKTVTAVTNLVDVPAFVVTTMADNFPVKSLKELAEYAKKNPGKLTYGTVGAGSYPHFDMAYFAKKAGVEMTALANKNGASGVIQDLLRGDVQAAFLNTGSSAGQVQAGKMRAIAVVNHTRLAEYPDVPTMKEAGFPDVGTIAWNGMFAPAGTPKPILEALHAAVIKAMNTPEAREKFKKQNYNIVPSKSVDEAQKWLTNEMKQWQNIITTVNLQLTQ